MKKINPALAHKLAKVHIMILDGSTHVTDILTTILANLGFSNVVVATNGYDGIQAMKKKPFHLVISDWDLKIYKVRPDETVANDKPAEVVPVSGSQFINRLRQSPSSPNPFVPVIMMAKKDSPDILAKARDAGVNEIIVNPLNAEQLCRRIISVITDKRSFITAVTYKGPCRRLVPIAIPAGMEERRKRQVRIIRLEKSS